MDSVFCIWGLLVALHSGSITRQAAAVTSSNLSLQNTARAVSFVPLGH